MRERVAAAGRDVPADQLPGLIAVDGSAASGKSTIGRMLAQRLGYRFLDTGIMYRAVTLAALDRAVDVYDEAALTELANALDLWVAMPESGAGEEARVLIDGHDVSDRLRSQEIDDNVSFVSRVAGVRQSLVNRQRSIAKLGRIVMAGRDIGSVVLPDAGLKVYLDASPEERARRRHDDFVSSGREASPDAVLEDLRRRDQLDSQRDISPQKPADDAVVIDTDGMSRDDVLERVLELAGR
jgi:CMP/dCMP kinase